MGNDGTTWIGLKWMELGDLYEVVSGEGLTWVYTRTRNGKLVGGGVITETGLLERANEPIFNPQLLPESDTPAPQQPAASADTGEGDERDADIAALRAENAALRAALLPFVENYPEWLTRDEEESYPSFLDAIHDTEMLAVRAEGAYKLLFGDDKRAAKGAGEERDDTIAALRQRVAEQLDKFEVAEPAVRAAKGDGA